MKQIIYQGQTSIKAYCINGEENIKKKRNEKNTDRNGRDGKNEDKE